MQKVLNSTCVKCKQFGVSLVADTKQENVNFLLVFDTKQEIDHFGWMLILSRK
jgi:hypothetical protein